MYIYIYICVGLMALPPFSLPFLEAHKPASRRRLPPSTKATTLPAAYGRRIYAPSMLSTTSKWMYI